MFTINNMRPVQNAMFLLFVVLLAFMFVGCHIARGETGILVYDYKNEKELSFIPTPREPGFYREMVVCANQDNSFITIQDIADECGLQMVADADRNLVKATILRQRDLNGNEISRHYLPFRVFINSDIGLSPDRTMAICEAIDSISDIREGDSSSHLWLIRNLKEDNLQTEFLKTDKEINLLSDAKSTNIVWVGNGKAFVRSMRNDCSGKLIFEILYVDVISKEVKPFCELDSMGMDLGISGNGIDKFAFVNAEKELCIVDDQGTIIAKIDFLEFLSTTDNAFIHSSFHFDWVDSSSICFWKDNEENTPYIMYNIDTGERRRGELADRYVRWLSPNLYGSMAAGGIVDISIPHKYCYPISSRTRFYNIVLLPNGTLVITADL